MKGKFPDFIYEKQCPQSLAEYRLCRKRQQKYNILNAKFLMRTIHKYANGNDQSCNATTKMTAKAVKRESKET